MFSLFMHAFSPQSIWLTVIVIFYLLWREAESQCIGQPGVDPQCKYVQTGMQILQICEYVQKCTNRDTNIFSFFTYNANIFRANFLFYHNHALTIILTSQTCSWNQRSCSYQHHFPPKKLSNLVFVYYFLYFFYTDLIFADLFSLTLFWIHFQIFALVKSRTSLAILEVADLSFWSLPRAVSAFLQGPPQSFCCLLPKIISATQHTTTQQQHNNTTSCKAHHNHSVVFCQNHQCNTTCIYMKYKYEYE